MINSEIILITALFISSLFGLQGALSLAINHLNNDEEKMSSSCNKILLTKEAFFVNIPISYLAIIFYIGLILQLNLLSNGNEIHFFWIKIEILFAVFATLYYSLVMILKLRIICFSCLRIHLANMLSGSSIMVYYFI